MDVSNSSASSLGPVVEDAGWQLIGTKYGLVATLALFLYDYFLTVPDEVEYVWKRSFSLGPLVTGLFLITRYYALGVSFVYILMAILPIVDMSVCVDRRFRIERSAFAYETLSCRRYIVFGPFASGIPMTFVPDVLIGLRVYALYRRNRVLKYALPTYLLAQLTVALWIYLTPGMHPVTMPGPPGLQEVPGLHACIAEASPSLGNLQSAAYQLMQTVYDSLAFGLIAYKTAVEAIGSLKGRSVKTLMARHGIIYFGVVFSMNLVWALMILFAPLGIKYSIAEPTVVLACLSVNRMTLSLRAFSFYKNEIEAYQPSDDSMYPFGFGRGAGERRRRRTWVGTSSFEVGHSDVAESEWEMMPPHSCMGGS